MRILAIDIGTGTRDILIFDPDKRLENCVQLVIPSKSKVMARRIRSMEGDLYLTGRTVGGGPMVKALRDHASRGNRVAFSPEAAYTVKNEMSKVLAKGIGIADEPFGTVIELDELEIADLQAFLATLGEELKPGDGIAIAAQDHGNAPATQSDREFRWERFTESLTLSPRLEPLVYTPADLPSCFLRLRSLADYLDQRMPSCRVALADTCVAAILGCLSPRGGYAPSPGEIVLVANLGNSHTMAAVMRDGEVLALFEHHTYEIENRMPRFARFLGQLVDGTIDTEEIRADEGEGAVVREAAGASRISRFLVTGPQRHLVQTVDFPFACRPEAVAPAGNMMLTGCLGLVDGFLNRYAQTTGETVAANEVCHE